MCRWFAYVSATEECLLEDVLVTPAHALTKQVHEHYLPNLIPHESGQFTTEREIAVRNRLFNVDGFGVVWYTATRSSFNGTEGGRPASYHNTQPPLNDVNFRSICENTATKTLFSHIRAATSGNVVVVNNHPFVFGRHTLMHNGDVEHFSLIKRQMIELMDQDCYINVKGVTDSEHFAALYMTYLTEGQGKASWEKEYPVRQMRNAMGKTVDTIVKLQKAVMGDKTLASTLNVATTDGRRLLAIRCHNHATQQPASLYWSTTAGTTLNKKYPNHPDGKHKSMGTKPPKEHGNHVIIASEPTTYEAEQWNLIPKNHCILYEPNGELVIDALEMPEERLAKANDTY